MKILYRRGFTLIELLVVVLIIGILAAVALPQYQKAVEKSRVAQAISFVSSAKKATSLYMLENGLQNIDLLGEDALDIDVTSGLDCSTGSPKACKNKYYNFTANCALGATCEITWARVEEGVDDFLAKGNIESADGQTWTGHAVYRNEVGKIICKAMASAFNVECEEY